jgi:hypothetical protein
MGSTSKAEEPTMREEKKKKSHRVFTEDVRDAERR